MDVADSSSTFLVNFKAFKNDKVYSQLNALLVKKNMYAKFTHQVSKISSVTSATECMKD